MAYCQNEEQVQTKFGNLMQHNLYSTSQNFLLKSIPTSPENQNSLQLGEEVTEVSAEIQSRDQEKTLPDCVI